MRVFVNVRFRDLQKYFLRLVREKVGPEIYLPSPVVKGLKVSDVKRTKKLLREAGLECTVHAPYLDLNLGALDGDVLRISRERIEKAVKVAVELEARRCVVHSFYDDYRYDFRVKRWFEVMAESVERLLDIVKGSRTLLVIENVFDRDPSALTMLCRKFSGEIGICFDPGHANLFTRVPWEEWLKSLRRHIRHMHMHDNDGERDYHYPPGRGNVPYEGILKALAGQPDFTVTIEPHRVSHVKPMLKFVRKWLGGEG